MHLLVCVQFFENRFEKEKKKLIQYTELKFKFRWLIKKKLKPLVITHLRQSFFVQNKTKTTPKAHFCKTILFWVWKNSSFIRKAGGDPSQRKKDTTPETSVQFWGNRKNTKKKNNFFSHFHFSVAGISATSTRSNFYHLILHIHHNL